MSRTASVGSRDEAVKIDKKKKEAPNEFEYESPDRKPSQHETRKQISEAFQRLAKMARLELANLTDASKASIAGLDTLIAKLQAKRFRCGVQIERDGEEVAVLDREIQKSEARLLK